jgi:hypothetical protein
MPTKFQILVKYRDGDGGWSEHGTEEAHNAEVAVRSNYLKNVADSSQVLAMVAVPARSWKPTPIRTETVTRVVLGDDGSVHAESSGPYAPGEKPEPQA